MLSFDEDGLDETISYGPQHSTPVKSQYAHRSSHLALHPKSKLTISQEKLSIQRECRDSCTSPDVPASCTNVSNREQCPHIAQHFIPDNAEDISQIPPSEASLRPLNLKTNQCNTCSCSSRSNRPFATENWCRENISEVVNSVACSDGGVKCKLCVVASSEGHDCHSQRLTQCRCKSKMSSPSQRSDACCSNSLSCHNKHKVLACKPSEASLSALTSGCCSPKQEKSSSYSLQSLIRNTVNSSRSGCRSPSSVCRSGCSRQKFRSHSLPRTGYSGVNLCNHSTELDGPTLSFAEIAKAPAIFSDNDIISKQREEIQLLMEELSGRDQELNDLVTSHQKQVRAWEVDRDKLDSLQARLSEYEDELSKKEQQLMETLEEMGRVQEQKELDLAELGKTQADMVKLAERITENSTYIHEIEVQNKSLGTSVKELLTDKKRLEEKERELMLQVAEKNAESVDQKAAIKKMAETIGCLENQVKVTEEKCRRKIQENEAWRAKFFMEKDEAEKLAADCDSKDLTMAKMTQQLQESLQQAVALQKALFTSCEREKCKEEVLHSLRKQHKRTMQELANTRELYDLRNRDLTTYHTSVKDPVKVTMRDKSTRSSMSDKEDHLERAGVLKDRLSAYKSTKEIKKDGDGSLSISNDISESRTDAQFDGDDLLNTCQSRLTNVVISPRFEVQECNPENKQHIQLKNHGDDQMWKQSSDGILHKVPVSAMSNNVGLLSDAKETARRGCFRHAADIVHPAEIRSQHPPIHSGPPQAKSPDQKQVCGQSQSQPQPQQGSEESHYSTASAASSHSHRLTYMHCTTPGMASHSKPECPGLTCISRARKSGTETKGVQEDHWVEDPLTAKSSPKRRAGKEDWRHRDQEGEFSPGKRTSRLNKVLSPSHSPSRRKKVEGQSEDHKVVNGHCSEGGAYKMVQTPQHKQKSSKHHEDQVVETKESLGSIISRHADVASPIRGLGTKLQDKRGEMVAGSENPQKIKLAKGRAGKEKTNFDENDGVANGLEKNDTLCRRSLIVNQQEKQLDTSVNYADVTHTRKKTANYSFHEEGLAERSPKKIGQGVHRTEQAQSLSKKDDKKSGRSTPGFCPSTSDVSNMTSPSRYDDELTPADSDGMCRELKRNIKEIRHQGSPRIKTSSKKSATFKKDDASSRPSFNLEDQDKTPQEFTKVEHQELDSPEETKRSSHSRDSRERRTPKSNAIHSEFESKSNASCHNHSPCGKSPIKRKHHREVSPKKKAITQEEEDRKTYSGIEGGEKSSGREKTSRTKRKKSRSSLGVDEEVEFSDKKLNMQMGSRLNEPTPDEDYLCEFEDDGMFHVKQATHQEDSKDMSLESKTVSAKQRWQEDAHHDSGYGVVRPQRYGFDDHPCVSPRSFEVSLKNYGDNNDVIGTSNKVTSYYSQYGSPDLSREPYFGSGHLHSSTTTSSKHAVGLGLGMSMARGSGVGLGVGVPSCKSLGGTYSSAGDAMCRHMPASSTTTTYTSRHFLPSGVGSYLSQRLNSWYHGSGSASYALNNNNENDSNKCNTGCDKSIGEHDDYTDESRSTRYSSRCHLNTNNNQDSGATEENGADDEINKDISKTSGEHNSNNNNIDPLNITDISLEEINDELPAKSYTGDFGKETSEGVQPQDKKVSGELSHTGVLLETQVSTESQLISPCNQETEPASHKPFTTRTQPSLYRQLAQIHFSEKTRRYEWVVVPPHLVQAQRQAGFPGNSSGQIDEVHRLNHDAKTKYVISSCIDTRPSSSTYGVDSCSHSSEDSSFVSASVHSFDTGCNKGEKGGDHTSKLPLTASTTTSTTIISSSHSDSGLCSLTSCEGLHSSTGYARQKSSDGSQPLASHGYECFNNDCLRVSNQTACAKYALKSACPSEASKLSKHAVSVSNMSPTAVPLISTAKETVSLNTCAQGDVTTTTNSNCHNSSICSISNSPPSSIMYSFMGVAPEQHLEPLCINVQPSGAEDAYTVDCQHHEKHLPQTKNSSHLDGIVKKLNFDDTTLEMNEEENAERLGTNVAEESKVVKKGEINAIDLEGNSEVVSSNLHHVNKMEVGSKDLHNTFEGPDFDNETSLCKHFHDISTLSVDAMPCVEADDSIGNGHLITLNTQGERLHDANIAGVCCHPGMTHKESSSAESGLKSHPTDPEEKLSEKHFVERSIGSCFNGNHKFHDKASEALYRTNPDSRQSHIYHYVSTQGSDTVHLERLKVMDANQGSPFDKPTMITAGKAWIYEDSVEETAHHFDNKLSSFLEEPELAEAAHKIMLQGSPPPMSPASKLHRLLLESQHLIWALEKSSAVPEALSSSFTHF